MASVGPIVAVGSVIILFVVFVGGCFVTLMICMIRALLSKNDDVDKLAKEYLLWRKENHKDAQSVDPDDSYFWYVLRKIISDGYYKDREKKEMIALASVVTDIQCMTGKLSGMLIFDDGSFEEEMGDKAYARAAEWLSPSKLVEKVDLLKKLLGEYGDREKKQKKQKDRMIH